MKQPNLNLSKSTGLQINKKKRKFRVMTQREFCDTIPYNGNCSKCSLNCHSDFCENYQSDSIRKDMEYTPYKTKDGKYILREVRE